MGGQRRIPAIAQQALHQPLEVRVDLGLAREGHRRGLAVGTLAQAHPRPLGDQGRHVDLAPPQRRLDHHPHVAPGVAHLTRKGERRVRRGVVLHVDAHEGTQRGRTLHDGPDVLTAEARVDSQAHLAQLEAHIPVEPRGGEGVECLDVAPGGTPGSVRRGDLLAQHVDRGAEPRGTEPLEREQCGIEVSPATNRATIGRVSGVRVARRPRARRRDSQSSTVRISRSGISRGEGQGRSATGRMLPRVAARLAVRQHGGGCDGGPGRAGRRAADR